MVTVTVIAPYSKEGGWFPFDRVPAFQARLFVFPISPMSADHMHLLVIITRVVSFYPSAYRTAFSFHESTYDKS